MGAPDEFDRLIGQLYEIVFEPEQLPTVLEQITQWLDGDTCHLVGWNGAARAPLLSTSIGLPDGVGPAYAAHYAAIDPRRALALKRMAPGQLIACHEHFDARAVSRDEFYQDYLLPTGVHYLLATTLVDDASHLIQIAFHRYLGHEHFNALEAQRMQRLVPHLQRAISMLLRGNALRQNAGIAASGLNTCSLALIAIDAHAQAVFCNRLAEALLQEESVLRLRSGALRAVNPADDSLLSGALAATAKTGKPCHLKLSTLPDNCTSAPARFSLTTMPVSDADRLGLQGGAAVLCLIAPIDRRRVASMRQLMELFGLTAAEARLARALGAGASLEEYAQANDLRPSTVKSQLRAVFAKTGSERQAALVRLVTAIPAVREPG